jgi:phosphoglycerate dehydrogenase-like enzyme
LHILVTTELNPEDRERLTASFPDIRFTFTTDQAEILGVLPGCEVVYCARITEEQIAAAAKLRWVQVRSAGVEHVPMDALFARDIVLTSGSGAHGAVMSENVLAMMLAFAVRIPMLRDAQRRGEWIAGRVGAEKFHLEGQTLLMIGLGAIGSVIARKAKALGMRVIGMRNRPVGKPEGVDEVVTREGLHAALGRADHVALCLPATMETAKLVGEAELRAMKPTAYLYNVGRSGAVDQEALIRALTDGTIAGAGLDVTDPEPLTQDHPLWALENVILTQHTAGASAENSTLVTDIFIRNLRQYLAGEPLKNAVDRELRY